MGSRQSSGALASECATFTRYLIGQDAAAEVVAAYQRAHDVSAVEDRAVDAALDSALLRVARQGAWLARLADSYAAMFARASLLRRKLVLLVAILESRGESAPLLDTARPGSRAGWVIEVGVDAVASLLRVVVALLLIVPLRLWYRIAK